jgi:protein-L-isoaspartate(D-aspartate) O-methyltransferase
MVPPFQDSAENLSSGWFDGEIWDAPGRRSGKYVALRFTFPPDEYAKPRERMVQDQIERRGVSDPRVLEAMRAVPRHRFLPADDRASAYEDTPLAIGCRQTVSQPYIVAYMTAALALQGGEQVLEIGTGSGYQTAILACLSRKVYSVERIPELADRARETLLALGIDNAEVIVGDGTAAPPPLPDPLPGQLAPSGRLIAPVGGRGVQELELHTRVASGIERRPLLAVVFVPLIGKFGWEEE